MFALPVANAIIVFPLSPPIATCFHVVLAGSVEWSKLIPSFENTNLSVPSATAAISEPVLAKPDQLKL